MQIVIDIMLYDAWNRPIREIKPIVDEMLEKGVEYKVVPRDKIGDSYGNLYTSAAWNQVYVGGKENRILVVEDSAIYVSEEVPDRFKPIVAAHEYGHTKGLRHAEIWNLELAAADKFSIWTNDPNLKEDYMRWSCSDDMLKQTRGNLGHEAVRESYDDNEKLYDLIKKKHGADHLFKKIEDHFVEV